MFCNSKNKTFRGVWGGRSAKHRPQRVGLDHTFKIIANATQIRLKSESTPSWKLGVPPFERSRPQLWNALKIVTKLAFRKKIQPNLEIWVAIWVGFESDLIQIWVGFESHLRWFWMYDRLPTVPNVVLWGWRVDLHSTTTIKLSLARDPLAS